MLVKDHWDGVSLGPWAEILFTYQFLFLQSKLTTPCSSGVHWIPGMERAEAKDVILAAHMDTQRRDKRGGRWVKHSVTNLLIAPSHTHITLDWQFAASWAAVKKARGAKCLSAALLVGPWHFRHGRNEKKKRLPLRWYDWQFKAHTWIQPEEACGAAEILPSERWIFLEVVNEYIIQSLRHKGSIQNVWIYRKKGEHLRY